MELSNAAREAKRAYERDYRARNPEKIREIKRRYWERRAAALAAKQQTEGASHE